MHGVSTTFKPAGVPMYEASSTFSVSFRVDDAIGMRSGKLDARARKEAVAQNKVDSDILREYWEIYEHDIRQATKSPSVVECQFM